MHPNPRVVYNFSRNVKLIFHWKLANQRKLNGHKQHEIYMANASPSRLGPNATLREMQILVFALGVTQILPFLDTKILVSPTRNCGVGGLSQCEDPAQMVLRRSGI